MRNMLIRALMSLVLPVSLAVSACAQPKAPPAPDEPPPPPPPVAELAVTPTGEGLPISSQIDVTVSNGSVKAVALADDKGAQVAGTLMGTTWVPDQPLA